MQKVGGGRGMIVLGIDTTSPYCSVSLVKDGTELAGEIVNNGNTHSEILLPLINKCLKSAGVALGEVDMFALSACPGSFTGVRIGASTVKGLAFASGKPCVGVSTLEALAYNLKGKEGYICPVMDARRNQFYNALFRWENDVLVRLCPDRLISAADLGSELSSLEGDVYFVGDGYVLAKKTVKCENIKDTEESVIPQNGMSVAVVGEKIYKDASDKDAFNDLVLKPGYLRASQAEREKNEKNQNRK